MNDAIPQADIYLVGGAVRDALLGLSANERDWVVVGSSEQQMEQLGYRRVGKDFPVFLHPKTHEEYALARRERKRGSGHKGFETHIEQVSLEQDLSRRDLTINAIAQSSDGAIVDPYHGIEDIENRVLRHVSDAFSEDPLRVLRIARFAAVLGRFQFTIAPETQQLLRSMSANGELNTLSPERVWRETEKALRSDSPRTFFEVLRSIGALEVIFPEIDALFGVPQRPEFHPEIDCGLHTLLSLDRISEQSDDSRLRFAVLIHDLGKATTRADIVPRHPGHEERSAQIAETLCERLRIPNRYRKLAILVARNHLLCHRSLRLPPAKLETLLSALEAWKGNSLLQEFANCCMADARGRIGLESRLYPQVEFLTDCAIAANKVRAKDLIEQGYSGAELGEQLRLTRAQLIEPVIQRYAHIDEIKYAKLP